MLDITPTCGAFIIVNGKVISIYILLHQDLINKEDRNLFLILIETSSKTIAFNERAR